MCDTELAWHTTNKTYKRNEDTTHIYVCPECPFVGFEYYEERNVKDLQEFLRGR